MNTILNNNAIPSSKAKWLFFNYMGGDNDLGNNLLKNIDQMEIVGSDKDTHIVAYIDAGNKPNPLDKKWSGLRGFYITKDDVPNLINSKVIADHGNKVNSSDPKILEKCGTEVVNNFNADYRMLILNNHGGGFAGAINDSSDGSSMSFMSMPQQREALEKIRKNTGKEFNIIGYDACLMGMLEVAYEVKDLADIFLASEENEAGTGWKYDSIFGARTMGETLKIVKSLNNYKVTVGPDTLAKIIVDVNKQHNNEIYTFSALNLKKIREETKIIINELADAIIKTQDKQVVRNAILNSENYGFGAPTHRDYRDLHHMCRLIQSGTKDENLKSATKKTLNWVEETAFANESNSELHPNSRGISIYAPLEINEDIDNRYKEILFAKETKWLEAIKSFATTYRSVPMKRQSLA